MLLVNHVKFAVSGVTIRRFNDFLIHRSLELQIDAGNLFFWNFAPKILGQLSEKSWHSTLESFASHWKDVRV